MCGITGYYLINSRHNSKKIVENMLNSIKHRGPDDSGINLFDTDIKEVKEYKHNLALSNSRLSIIDLSKKGHQPMFNDDKSICLVYNGEIFNYVEIKKILEKKGHKFKSNSDTEVIIKAYEEYGFDCLNQFNGMWAFVLYDMKQNILFCSRDRFGIKPFYYYLDEDSFVFGSEIKSILEFPIKSISVNENQIIRSIVQGYRFVDGGRDSFYKEIKQLLPAEYLIVDMNKNNFKFKRYWEVDFEKKTDLKDEKKIIAKFRNLLIDAVKIRLRSDVPLAFTLSGGLDSSSIISITKKILKKDTIAFSAVYSKGNKYDEQDYIEPTIEDLGIKYHFIKVDLGDFFENLKKMIKFNDEPICTVTFYSQWQVMKRIREKGFKVALSGFAADEIVSGYYDHYLYYFYDLYKEKKYDLLKNELDMWKKNHDKSLDQWHRFKKNLDNSEFLSPKKEEYIKLFRKDILKKFVEKKQSNYTSSMLKNRMYNELRKESVPVALKPEDRHSMMFSIESRVPFLDYRLVEFCFSIPDSLKIKNGLAKYILRESMKNIVNKKVRTRKEKVGFNAPMYEWIKNELRDDIENLLHDGDLNIYQFIDKDMLLKLWDEHINEKDNHMMLFWNVLNIEFWLRYFNNMKNNGIIGANLSSL